jgi:hypothetical protein
MSNPPKWFGPALAIARHKDQKSQWPWYSRLAHWLFVSWRCQCCQAERARKKGRLL